MKPKTSARVLGVSGAVLMLWAQLSDVTVDTGLGIRVANIHLMSQRQNLLIFGGFMFLAGVILFAVARLKETPEEAARDEAQLLSKRKEAVAAVESTALAAKGVLEKISVASKSEFEAPARRITGFYRSRGGLRGIVVRLVIGFTAGLCAFLLAVSLGAMLIALIALLACVGYPLISPSRAAMPRMLSAVLVLSILAAAFGDQSQLVVSMFCGGYVAFLLLLFWIDAKRGEKNWRRKS